MFDARLESTEWVHVQPLNVPMLMFKLCEVLPPSDEVISSEEVDVDIRCDGTVRGLQSAERIGTVVIHVRTLENAE